MSITRLINRLFFHIKAGSRASVRGSAVLKQQSVRRTGRRVSRKQTVDLVTDASRIVLIYEAKRQIGWSVGL